MLGVPFLLHTFLWASKEKYVGAHGRAQKPVTRTTGPTHQALRVAVLFLYLLSLVLLVYSAI